MSIVYIALEFPPVQTAGMFRSYEMVKRLHAKGAKLSVLSLSPSKWFFGEKTNDKLLEEFPSDVPIYRFNDETVRRPSSRWGWFKRIFFRALSDSFHSDTQAQSRELFHRIEREHKPKVVIASVPPFGASQIARDAVRFLKCPLVLDFRDAWSQWESNGLFPTRFHFNLLRRLERSTIADAHTVLTVTPELTSLLARENDPQNTDRFLTLPNGHSVDLDDLPTPDLRSVDDAEQKPLRIGYVGRFYYQPDWEKLAATPWYRRPLGKQFHYLPLKEQWIYRGPFPFLRALGQLFKRRPELRGKVEFHLLGDVPDWLPGMVEECDVKDACVFHGFLPKHEAMEISSSFDGFLATSMKREDGGDYCLASKTFDYVRFAKPVLGFVCPGSQKNFLDRAGIGECCDPDDPEDGARLLERFAEGKIEVKPCVEFLQRFHLDQLSDNLLKILHSVGEQRPVDRSLSFEWNADAPTPEMEAVAS